MTEVSQIDPAAFLQMPIYMDHTVPHISEQVVMTSPGLKPGMMTKDTKPPPSLCLDVFDDKVENSPEECQADLNKQQKGVGINVRYKGNRLINKTESSIWHKLKAETKADIEKVLREESERFQHVDDTPVAGGSFQQLVQQIEHLRASYRPDMENKIDVKEMRKFVPVLRKLCYLNPSEIENKGKVKNIWSKRPEDWPMHVRHVDPNNPGCMPSSSKKYPKPNKQQLEKMFYWLMEKYESRRGELMALLTRPDSGMTNQQWFDDGEEGQLFSTLVEMFNNTAVTEACLKLYSKLYREPVDGIEEILPQIDAQQKAVAMLRKIQASIEKNVWVDVPDFVNKLNECFDQYQAKCFQYGKAPQVQIPSTLTVDIACSPQTPDTFTSLGSSPFPFKQEKTGPINTILVNPSSPQEAVAETVVALEGIGLNDVIRDTDLDECLNLLHTQQILQGQNFMELFDGVDLNVNMDLDMNDQGPLNANPMMSDALPQNTYMVPQTEGMIPSFVSEEEVGMEM